VWCEGRRVQGEGCGPWGVGCGVKDGGFRVRAVGLGVWGVEFIV
jgi:hypothetical protein